MATIIMQRPGATQLTLIEPSDTVTLIILFPHFTSVFEELCFQQKDNLAIPRTQTWDVDTIWTLYITTDYKW